MHSKPISHQLWTAPATREAFFLLTNNMVYSVASYEEDKYTLRMYVECLAPGQPKANGLYPENKTQTMMHEYFHYWGYYRFPVNIQEKANLNGKFAVPVHASATKNELLNGETKIPDFFKAVEEARIISAIAIMVNFQRPVICSAENPLVILCKYEKERNKYWTIDEERADEFTDALNIPFSVQVGAYDNVGNGSLDGINIKPNPNHLLAQTLKRLGIDADCGFAINGQYLVGEFVTTITISDPASLKKLSVLCKEYRGIAQSICF